MSTRQNRISGPAVAQQIKVRYPKTDLRYWQNVVEKRSYRERNSGETRESRCYSVRIGFQKRRERFPLQTPNKMAAAERAKKIWNCLAIDGWGEALAKYHPDYVKKGGKSDGELEVVSIRDEKSVATVGEFLSAAALVTKASPKTFATYCSEFRRMVADISGIEATEKRFDYLKGGRMAWLEKVDSISLGILTVSAVQKWAVAFVNAAKSSPREKVKAKRAVNSKLQRFKALFSEQKILRYIRDEIVLPDEIPFAHIEPFEDHPDLYHSEAELPRLIRYAQSELGTPQKQESESDSDFHSRHQQFKIFILAVCVGLRRAEIDKLKWEQVDFEGSTISIYPTDVMTLKRPSAIGTMDVEPTVMGILKEYQSKTDSPYVIESKVKPRLDAKYAHYRANRHYKKLLVWLREHGLTQNNKGIQTLRKEAGSQVNENGGLIASQRFLRHADSRTTARHYVDKRGKTTVGLGQHFNFKHRD